MQASKPATGRLPGLVERRSTRAAFLLTGFGMACWAPLVPYARDRLHLDEATLGLLLLCLGLGSMATMPLAGALTARLGCRRVIIGMGLLVAVSLPLLATVAQVSLLAGALAVFGGGFGGLCVGINVQAVIVEQASGRALMSGFHGMFSIGGIIGSGGMTALLWAGFSPLSATLCAVAAMSGLLFACERHLLSHAGGDRTALFALPRKVVLFIGVLCFIIFLAEGAMLDWSAIVLTTLHGMSRSSAGSGYAVFAVAMSVGRLTGDRVVQRIGGRRVLAVGASCAATGLIVAVVAPPTAAALVGFGMVGLGSSNIVPVLFSVLGRQQAMPANLAVAAASTLGFSGILTGPALIGLVARATSLPVAFLGVAAMVFVVAASSRIASSQGA